MPVLNLESRNSDTQILFLSASLIALFYANGFFDNFILAEDLFAKVLQSLETFVFVSNNLCRNLFSSLELPKTFNRSFKVTSVPFFLSDFSLLSCELENFTFKVLY